MKNLLLGFLTFLYLLTNICPVADAMCREDIAKINIKREKNFKYWTAESNAKKILVEYVKDVVNPNSQNFIPVSERVAVFDCDGTLIGERNPYYFEGMMFLHRNADPNVPLKCKNEKAVAQMREIIAGGSMPVQVRQELEQVYVDCLAWQTPEEYREYVRHYITTEKVEGYTNLKVGEEFFLPMVEIVSYLRNNKFSIYIVTGSERDEMRVYCEPLKIPYQNIIGSDHSITTERMGNSDSSRYFYGAAGNEKIMRGNELAVKNLNFNKIIAINREIGIRPVLAFGNGSGDMAMFNYTVMNNRHRALAFAVLCDDTERENGSLKSAGKMRKNCEKYGWIPISMKNDFATIYGYDVKKL